MHYLQVFITGGIICAVGQALIDKTRLTSARILVLFVCLGAALSFLGIYKYIAEFGGAGATIPLTGFGHALAKGTIKAIGEDGFIGVLTGGLSAVSAGISAVLIFALLAALAAKPKDK